MVASQFSYSLPLFLSLDTFSNNIKTKFVGHIKYCPYDGSFGSVFTHILGV